MSPDRRFRLSRRELIVGSAGLALLAACGGDDDAGGGSDTGAAAAGFSLVKFFGPDGAFAEGVENRVVFGVGDGDGVLLPEPPTSLAIRLADGEGRAIADTSVNAVGEGLPRRYYSLPVELAAGIYRLTTEVDGAPVEFDFQIQSKADVPLLQPGDAMRPVETPTVDDDRDVTPICTRTPACSFHGTTLTDALGTGRPVAFLIATPEFCQTAICAPVLDVLADLAPDFEGFDFVHAEVFKNPAAGVGTADSYTEAVSTYGLSFEPSLYVTDEAGTLRKRLDFIFGAEEARAALEAARTG